MDRWRRKKRGAPVDPLYAIVNDANVSFDSERSIAEYRVQDNDHLKLGRRREPAYMFRYVNWYRVSILSTVAGLIGIAGLCACYVLLRQTPQKVTTFDYTIFAILIYFNTYMPHE
ncbi:unnamed protein product [Allacma fusca]|uniref:Uncharacterized protein n=1 Tax=Allacma fusca TaxID=39272 RepID=A0A8J2NW19_9HEXA|nr:unnamed protein product [Allacma fusca]